MKVLHLVRKDTQLKSSFIQNQIINHLEFEASACYYEKRNESFFVGFDSIQDKKIQFVSVNSSKSLFNELKFKFLRILDKQSANELISYIESFKPDVIHLHYGSDAGIYLKHLKKLSIPKVVSFYGYDCFSFPKKLFGLGRLFLNKRVFNYSDKILAMSPVMSQDIINLGCCKDKVSVHYHGVPDNLSTIYRKFESKKSLNLLMLSYLDPVKGHLFVLDALKSLVDSGITNFHLNIVGEGHFKEAIEQKIIELKLVNHVSLLGKVSYLSKEYFETFHDADIFLHPSVITQEDKEGIPGSLVEAMFAALPVIATYHGGIPFVVEHDRTGMLVNEWDTLALANAISKCLLDNETRSRLGLAARTFAINNLDLYKKEQELEEIYKSLIKR